MGSNHANKAQWKLGKVELVPIDQLLYVQGAGAYSELVLDNGSRQLHDKTLDKLHAIVPAAFERIHKSYLLRITAVAALHALGGSQYEAELKSGVRLPVGRSRYRALRGRLK